MLRHPRSENASPEFTIPTAPTVSGLLKHDVIITAVAAGQRPLDPELANDETRGFFAYPFAITGPIFVDVDGDGKCTPPSPEKLRPGTEAFWSRQIPDTGSCRRVSQSRKPACLQFKSVKSAESAVTFFALAVVQSRAVKSKKPVVALQRPYSDRMSECH